MAVQKKFGLCRMSVRRGCKFTRPPEITLPRSSAGASRRGRAGMALDTELQQQETSSSLRHPFSLNDGLRFQETSHHSAGSLVSSFSLFVSPLKSLRAFTQSRTDGF